MEIKRKRVNLMKTANRIKLLRTGFWVGGILDGIYAVNMALVWLFDSYSGFDPLKMMRFTGGLQSRYAWGFACVMVTGWTTLMFWADRKPLERRGIILLTAFPIVSGLLIDSIFAVIVNLETWQKMMPLQIVYIFLIILFTTGYQLTNTRNIRTRVNQR
jgi:hypothetical protein